MAGLIWTERARNELDAARLHIARDSRLAAQRFVARVEAAVEQAAAFPRSGRMVPEIRDDNIRELIVQRYRIVYRLRNDIVEIISVRHGARLLRFTDVADDVDSE
jgi:toxin ParE1/3/4